MFGWEMVKLSTDEIGQKIATFKNVDTGEVIEKPFTAANINPKSAPHPELLDGGIADESGLVEIFISVCVPHAPTQAGKGCLPRGQGP